MNSSHGTPPERPALDERSGENSPGRSLLLLLAVVEEGAPMSMSPEPHSRPRRALVVAVFGLSLLTAGCATNGSDGVAPSSAAERGRDLAELRCGGCHGLGLYGESPRSPSTPFRDMRRRLTALSLQQRLTDITEGRHYDMPRLGLSASETEDIAAYIESLERP